MNLSVYDGARWVSITPHAFSHAIGGKDELIPEAIGAASTLFVEDAIAAHLDETDPHPQYLTQSEGDTLYAGAGAISDHVATLDPHPQYLTQSEGDTLYAGAGAISDHVATLDPHPQYLTQSEGDTLYAGAGAFSTHVATLDPHPQYLTQSEGDTLYAGAGAISDHVAASDPHPQYLTQGEGNTLYAGAGAFSTHVAASDPHPQYLTQGEGDTLYAGAGAISTHVAASDPHPQYLTQSEGDTLYAPNNVITSHLAVSNPHLITPTLIGAAAASHTHSEDLIQWQEINFLSGWEHYGSPWSPCRMALINNIVYFCGLIGGILQGTTNPTSGLLFTIPQNYCPTINTMLTCSCNLNKQSGNHFLLPIQVSPNGSVSIHYSTQAMLEQIHWINITGSFFKV